MDNISDAFLLISPIVDKFTIGSDTIRYDVQILPLWNELLAALKPYLELANAYCKERDDNSKTFESAKNKAEAELKTIFTDGTTKIKLMSSYGAKTYLNGNSDIDFGVIINCPEDDFYQNLHQKLMETNGFTFKHRLFNYFVYQKVIDGIEIESKIRRKCDQSDSMVKLHKEIDSLPVQTKNLITYAKLLLVDDAKLYGKLKWLMYSTYYTICLKRNQRRIN